MTKILLLSAAYLNGGSYVDAGTEVPVGDDKLEMTAERADMMITARLAEELPDDEEAADEAGDGADTEGGEPKPTGRAGARGK